MNEDKLILDACCGSRMFWFDKKNPNVLFQDIRDKEYILCDGRKLEVHPDVILRGANLVDANLRGAYLCGANLCGANLGGAWGKLLSTSDMLVVGAIGSRNAYTTIFHTGKGIFVLCGCFRGTLDEFAAKVKETHAGTKHERDYNALIDFVRIKFSDYDV